MDFCQFVGRILLRGSVLWLLCSWSALGNAKVLFEGWSEVLISSKKIGYYVERYDFDNKKFHCTYYLHTDSDGHVVNESLKATADDALTPVDYTFISTTEDKSHDESSKNETKVIKADFVKKKDKITMMATIGDGKTSKKKPVTFDKHVFLEPFLVYVIMADAKHGGLKLHNNYIYASIAQEDADLHKGETFIEKMEDVNHQKAFVLKNKYKVGEKDSDGNSLEQDFSSWVTKHGERLLTRQPAQDVEVRYVDSFEKATDGFKVNMSTLNFLFDHHVPGVDIEKKLEPDKGPKDDKHDGDNATGP